MKSMKTVAEFFAGIGLMRLGLEKAGWQTVWANDIDTDKQKIYMDQFGQDEGCFVFGDVHHISASCIPAVSLATASFPCNDLSLAGARRGLAGKHSSAFWGFFSAVRDMQTQPPMLLLENVTGFLTSHGGGDFQEVCLALNSLGYEVDSFIIDASLFVPQSRQRMFIVAQKTLQKPRLLAETASFYESQIRPRPLADFILRHPEIAWSVRELPAIRKRDTHLSDILEAIPKTSSIWWSKTRADYLLSQMSQKHRSTANRMIAAQEISHGTVFRRVRYGKCMAELRTDGIAGCLRTPRGGSGRQILFEAGRGQFSVRLLTPRECARLMGADDFHLETSANKALFGFGDAVCVPVIQWIAENYLNPLLDELCLQDRRNSKKVRYA